MEEFQFEKGTPIEVLAGTGPQEMTRFLFEGWQGSHTSEENPHTFIPESDMLIYPVFGEYVELHTSVRSMTGEPVGGSLLVHTEPEREGLYKMFQEIRVEAVPDEGWEFVQWDLAFSGRDNPSIQQASSTPGEAVFRRVETGISE